MKISFRHFICLYSPINRAIQTNEDQMKENIIEHLNPNILMNRKDAAEFLGVAESTLAYWKCVGRYNLKYVKIGRLVKYRIRDLEDFIEKGLNFNNNRTL